MSRFMRMSNPLPPCFAPKGFFCSTSDPHPPEQCPENWYCRGGLLQPERCPNAKWSAVGSAYLADCGSRMEADVAVVVAIIIVLAGLALCVYLGWSEMCTSPSEPIPVCIVPAPGSGYDDYLCPPPGARPATAYQHGRQPVYYYAILAKKRRATHAWRLQHIPTQPFTFASRAWTQTPPLPASHSTRRCCCAS